MMMMMMMAASKHHIDEYDMLDSKLCAFSFLLSHWARRGCDFGNFSLQFEKRTTTEPIVAGYSATPREITPASDDRKYWLAPSFLPVACIERK
jgi:hypothetical protein